MENSKEFTPKGEDEIREQVIADYSLNPDDDADKPLIEKAVKKELDWQAEKLELSKKEKVWEQERIEHEKKLSKAIEQKAKYREEAKKLATLEETPPNGEPKPTGDTTTPATPVDNEKLSALEKEIAELKNSQQRRDFSHLTDEEYNSINAIAIANNKGFKEVYENDPIVKSFLETNKVNQRIAGATTAPSTRTNATTFMSPEEVDLNNPEHVKLLKSDPKKLEAYEAWLEKGGSKNLKNLTN